MPAIINTRLLREPWNWFVVAFWLVLLAILYTVIHQNQGLS